MKKFIALLTALGLMLSFTACSKKDEAVEETTYEEQIAADEMAQLEEELFGDAAPFEEDTTSATVETTTALNTETVTGETTTNPSGETVTNVTDKATTNTLAETVTNNGSKTTTNNASKTTTNNTNKTTTKAPVSTTKAPSGALSANPAEWSKDQIVKYYKYAAAKSSNVTSKKTMVMKELTVNDGDGLLAKFVDMATPLFKDALAKNSTEFIGITGGYGNLVPSDIKSAKAYKSGNYTIIEMTMVEQVDGAHGKEKEGTVGHAISVVGDLAVIEENLPMFDIDFENSETKIKYTNPTVKVKINNKTHQIEKGTWSYDVNVDIRNLYIKNLRLPIEVTIKSGKGSVAFNVTVGGGF